MTGLVDTNFHVVAPSSQRAAYPLDPMPGTQAEFSEDQSTTVEDCLAIMDEAGVDQGYLIASRFHGFDNTYCADSVARHPDRFIAIANINILAPDAAERVDHWIGERGLHGVRFWGSGRGSATWIDDPGCRAAWERVRAHGVPANAHTTTPDVLPLTRQFLKTFDEIPLTINHLGHIPVEAGGASAEIKDLVDLAAYPRVYVNFPVDLAVAITKGSGPAREVLDTLLTNFGPERLIWSAFYPSRQDRPYAESIRLLRTALDVLSERDRDWVLGGAARALYPTLAKADQS